MTRIACVLVPKYTTSTPRTDRHQAAAATEQQQQVYILDTRGNLPTACPDDPGSKEVSDRVHQRNISDDMRNRGTGEIN